MFFKEQLAVFKLIICSEKRSLGAPEDVEVTLNNYFRSFSVGYSLFPRSEKDIFRVLHHIDWRKQELQYSTIVSENLFVLKPNNKFKEQLGLRNDINS